MSIAHVTSPRVGWWRSNDSSVTRHDATSLRRCSSANITPSRNSVRRRSHRRRRAHGRWRVATSSAEAPYSVRAAITRRRGNEAECRERRREHVQRLRERRATPRTRRRRPFCPMTMVTMTVDMDAGRILLPFKPDDDAARFYCPIWIRANMGHQSSVVGVAALGYDNDTLTPAVHAMANAFGDFLVRSGDTLLTEWSPRTQATTRSNPQFQTP